MSSRSLNSATEQNSHSNSDTSRWSWRWGDVIWFQMAEITFHPLGPAAVVVGLDDHVLHWDDNGAAHAEDRRRTRRIFRFCRIPHGPRPARKRRRRRRRWPAIDGSLTSAFNAFKIMYKWFLFYKLMNKLTQTLKYKNCVSLFARLLNTSSHLITVCISHTGDSPLIAWLHCLVSFLRHLLGGFGASRSRKLKKYLKRSFLTPSPPLPTHSQVKRNSSLFTEGTESIYWLHSYEIEYNVINRRLTSIKNVFISSSVVIALTKQKLFWYNIEKFIGIVSPSNHFLNLNTFTAHKRVG